MYTRKEASKIRQEFWTTFGRYMLPVTAANDDKVNWVNYKTGIRNIFFRMETSGNEAKVKLVVKGTDEARLPLYQKLKSMKPIFNQSAGDNWQWHVEQQEESGETVSAIETTLTGVNIFNKADWPALISFFKKSITGLDQFWFFAKEVLE